MGDPEFEWEKLFKESDARTDKYMEVFEKCKDHPDCEKLIAKEMGWEELEQRLEELFQQNQDSTFGLSEIRVSSRGRRVTPAHCK